MTRKRSDTSGREGGKAGRASRADRRRRAREGKPPAEGEGKEARRRRARDRKGSGPGEALPFTARNAILGAAGLVSVGLGYYFLAQGSITLAPILLVVGFAVLLPLALIL